MVAYIIYCRFTFTIDIRLYHQDYTMLLIYCIFLYNTFHLLFSFLSFFLSFFSIFFFYVMMQLQASKVIEKRNYKISDETWSKREVTQFTNKVLLLFLLMILQPFTTMLKIYCVRRANLKTRQFIKKVFQSRFLNKGVFKQSQPKCFSTLKILSKMQLV